MIRDAIDKVLELRDEIDIVINPKSLEENRVFTKHGYSEVKPYEQCTMPLATLDAFVAFCGLTEVTDRVDTFITVSTDAVVNLWSAPHPVTKIRDSLARCAPPQPTAITGLSSNSQDKIHWMAPAEIIPLVLIGFEDTPERQSLLKVLGNVRDGAERTFADDGVTQQVSTRKGVSMSELTQLPSPLTLVPLANYPEVANVEQSYILRATGGDENSPPNFLLLRVNDPIFFLKRRDEIVEFLSNNVQGIPVI
jgi:hypothetical protein